MTKIVKLRQETPMRNDKIPIKIKPTDIITVKYN